MHPIEALSANAYMHLHVMTRLVFAFQLLPIPGFRSLSQFARAAIAMVLSAPVTLYASAVAGKNMPVEVSFESLFADAAFGCFAGALTVILLDALALVGQLLATQSGFTYGATIDPLSDVDSGLLPTVLGLSVAAIFYASPLFPSLVMLVKPETAAAVPNILSPQAAIALGSFAQRCFETALCLALPISLLAFLTDLACALTARHLPQLQLLSILLGIKPAMIVALIALCLPAMQSPIVRLIERVTLTLHGFNG